VLTCSRCNARFRFIPKPLNDLISLDDLEKHYNF
jgi:hypothetical protein